MAASESRVEVLDVGLQDGVSRSILVEDSEGVLVHTIITKKPLPEYIMDRLEQLTGNGDAAITVGADITTSEDYGCKAGAFCSVKVTCNNDEDSIRGAHEIARELAQEFVVEDQQEAHRLLYKALNRAAINDIVDRSLPGDEDVEEVVEKKPAIAPSKVGTKTKVQLKNKPNFKRG